MSVTYPDGTSQHYTYNPLGQASQYLNAAGQTTNLTYNAQGQVTNESFADDGMLVHTSQ